MQRAINYRVTTSIYDTFTDAALTGCHHIPALYRAPPSSPSHLLAAVFAALRLSESRSEGYSFYDLPQPRTYRLLSEGVLQRTTCLHPCVFVIEVMLQL